MGECGAPPVVDRRLNGVIGMRTRVVGRDGALHGQIADVEGVFLDELAAGFDLAVPSTLGLFTLAFAARAMVVSAGGRGWRR